MPRPGLRWRHNVINTKGTWLHGDSRGFRSRGHRIHSSGDYNNPPPRGEHTNLHAYMKGKSKGEVTIPYALRAMVGRAIVEALKEMGYRVLAVSVGKVHSHQLVELPNDLPHIRRIVGELKRKSSRAVKKALPGAVWAEGGQPEPVYDPDHQKNAFDYILYKQGAGAWTWSYRDATDDGIYKRKPPKNPRRRSALPRREP